MFDAGFAGWGRIWPVCFCCPSLCAICKDLLVAFPIPEDMEVKTVRMDTSQLNRDYTNPKDNVSQLVLTNEVLRLTLNLKPTALNAALPNCPQALPELIFWGQGRGVQAA